jgi:putative transposase
MTGFDPAGHVLEWGKGDMSRICNHLYTLDRLQSKAAQVNARKRYRMRKAAARIRQKVHDLITDAHRKLVKHLLESYDVVLLPSFETQQMVNTRGSKKRMLTHKTVRQMLTWRHYSFKQRLLSKAREYPWVRVEIVDEAYTSKTCTHCGVLNETLGGAKWFKCKACGTQLDRDYNGGRNIYIKNHGCIPTH